MRPLFIIGNKRSGTSQLVRVLNLHPQIFISHESDIVWILHQFHGGQKMQAHSWDSDRGMKLTLEIAGPLLRRAVSPKENFIAAQTAVMQAGTPWLPPQKKTGLRWIGDKKPMQHADPALLKFISTHFPDAHFLHVVRHPFEVVESSNRFNRTRDGDFWLELSPEEKLARWTFHEQRVLQLRDALPGRVHSLRYEDFCSHTQNTLSAVFKFLELEAEAEILEEAARQTSRPKRIARALNCPPETARVAAIYGYDVQPRNGKWRALAQKIFGNSK